MRRLAVRPAVIGSLAVTAGLVAMSAAPALAATSQTTNGGFETPAIGASPGYQTFPTGSTGITGWTVSSGTVDLVDASLFQPNSGAQSLDLDGTNPGTLAQSVTVQPGMTYHVAFALAGNPNGGPTIKSLTVTFGGQAHPYTFDTTGRSPQNMGWTPQGFDVTVPASGSTSALTFASGDPSNSNGGPEIDDVSVTATPGPAPSLPEVPYTALLALGGLAAIGAVTALRHRTA